MAASPGDSILEHEYPRTSQYCSKCSSERVFPATAPGYFGSVSVPVSSDEQVFFHLRWFRCQWRTEFEKCGPLFSAANGCDGAHHAGGQISLPSLWCHLCGQVAKDLRLFSQIPDAQAFSFCSLRKLHIRGDEYGFTLVR
jgi:hypothetical protein